MKGFISRIILFTFSCFLIGGSIFFASCEKDCPDGFSGKDCEVRQSDTFLGTYEGFVNCGLINEYTKIDIFRKNGPFDVSVDFVLTPEFILNASVFQDSIRFPQQVLGIPEGTDTLYYIIFESTGLLKGDTLDFPLIILFPGNPDQEKITCQYHLVK